jgi:hypothetical protein
VGINVSVSAAAAARRRNRENVHVPKHAIVSEYVKPTTVKDRIYLCLFFTVVFLFVAWSWYQFLTTF